MEVKLDTEAAASLKADECMRIFYEVKFKNDRRHSSHVFTWAQQRADAINDVLLKQDGPDSRYPYVRMLEVRLRKKHQTAYLCFDVFFGYKGISKGFREAQKAPTLCVVEKPIFQIARKGKTLMLWRKRNLDKVIAKEFEERRMVDRGKLPYFVDERNPPVYKDGKRVEGPERIVGKWISWVTPNGEPMPKEGTMPGRKSRQQQEAEAKSKVESMYRPNGEPMPTEGTMPGSISRLSKKEKIIPGENYRLPQVEQIPFWLPPDLTMPGGNYRLPQVEPMPVVNYRLPKNVEPYRPKYKPNGDPNGEQMPACWLLPQEEPKSMDKPMLQDVPMSIRPPTSPHETILGAIERSFREMETEHAVIPSTQGS